MSLLTRFAPTPSGLLHPGNAFSFLLTWALARHKNARILLRIDDLDAARARPEFVEDVFRSIEWLGLDYDTGPGGPEEFFRHYSQQLRLPLYDALLAQLQQGGHLFACTCSRTAIRATSAEGHYPGTCRELARPLHQPDTAWRVKTPQPPLFTFPDLSAEAPLHICFEPDFIVRRKDGLPAYQIASLADDLHYGVNLVVRGADLLPSTAAQLFLANLPGERNAATAAFLQTEFYHHPLIEDQAGHKLSKSKGAGSLKAMREQGVGPAAIVERVGQFLGMIPPLPQTPVQLLERFALSRLQTERPA